MAGSTTGSRRWKIANGIFGENFWKGTWLGNMPGHGEATSIHALHGGEEHAVSPIAKLQEVANVIARTGIFHDHPFMPSFSIEAM